MLRFILRHSCHAQLRSVTQTPRVPPVRLKVRLMEDEYTEKVYDIAADQGSTLLSALMLNGVPIQCLDFDRI